MFKTFLSKQWALAVGQSTGHFTRLAAIFAAVAVALAAPQFANATPVTSGSTFDVDWTVVVGTKTAKATAIFSGFDLGVSHKVSFLLDVINTSPSPIGLAAFGWITSPTTTAANEASSAFSASINKTLGGGGGAVNVCFFSSGNACGTSDVALPSGGTTGNFLVTITLGSNVVPPLDFSGFDAVFYDGNTTKSVLGSINAPEPPTMALLATGFIGIGLIRRRRAARLKLSTPPWSSRRTLLGPGQMMVGLT